MLKAVASILIVTALGVTAFSMWSRQGGDGYEAAEVGFVQDPVLGGVVTLDGLIVSATVERFDGVIAAHAGAVRVLRVTSPGGITAAADRLAEAVNRAGLVVRIEREDLCSSACVMFLAGVPPGKRVIDAGAWLRVHGGSARLPGEVKEAGSEYMSAAVQVILPAWLAFLRQCRSEPLLREAGLAMLWGEVQGLERAGRRTDCEAIAYRDKDWLFTRYFAARMRHSAPPLMPTVWTRFGAQLVTPSEQGTMQVVRPSR